MFLEKSLIQHLCFKIRNGKWNSNRRDVKLDKNVSNLGCKKKGREFEEFNLIRGSVFMTRYSLKNIE